MGSLAQGPLPDLLQHFRASYPGVAVRVEEAGLDENLAGITGGRLDIAFVIGEPVVEDCDAIRVWEEPLVIAASATHPIVQEAMVRWPALADENILISADSFGMKVAEIVGARLRRFGRKPRLSMQRVGRDNLMYLVSEGFGITMTSESMLADPYSRLNVAAVHTGDQLNWSAVWSKNSINPALKNLIKRLRRLAIF